jgi:putative endonuclease
MYITYILFSTTTDRYYVGSTSDLIERLRKHNNKSKGFTNRATDWEIKFQRIFPTISEARDFEMKIKSWKSRKAIEKLIAED